MWKTTSVDSRSSSPYNSWTKKKLLLLLYLIITSSSSSSSWFLARERELGQQQQQWALEKQGVGEGAPVCFLGTRYHRHCYHHFGILVSSINLDKQVMLLLPVAYCSIKYFLFSAIVSAPDDAVFVPRCCSHFSPRCHHGFVAPTSLSFTTSYQGPEER